MRASLNADRLFEAVLLLTTQKIYHPKMMDVNLLWVF
jgi:hypothetical protein